MFNYTVMFGSDPNYYTDFYAVQETFESIDDALKDALSMVKAETLNDNATVRIYNYDDELVMRIVVRGDVL